MTLSRQKMAIKRGRKKYPLHKRSEIFTADNIYCDITSTIFCSMVPYVPKAFYYRKRKKIYRNM